MRRFVPALLLVVAPVVAGQQGTQPIDQGKWRIEHRTAKWREPTSAVLHVESNERRGGKNGGETVRLVLRCRGESMDGYILWSERGALSLRGRSAGFVRDLGTTAAVSIQFDDGPLQTSHWGVTTDDRGTVVPEVAMRGFIEDLQDAEVLRAHVTPNSRREISVSFEVRGLRHALAPLDDRCKW